VRTVGGLSRAGVRRFGTELIADLRIGDEFGRLEIGLTDGGRTIARVDVEVRPRYLDPDQDFKVLQEDLELISYSLAYALWRQAFVRMYPGARVPPGVAEWLAMLRYQWDRLAKGVLAIERDPNKDLETIIQILPPHLPARVDARGLQWLAMHPNAWTEGDWAPPIFFERFGDKKGSPIQLPDSRKRVTYDTPANRALKAELSRLASRLGRAIVQVNKVRQGHFSDGQRREYLNQLQHMHRQVRRLIRAEYLREVQARMPANTAQLHVVRADPRYRSVFNHLRALRWALVHEVRGAAFEIGLKDTWLLYEYWVFLHVIRSFIDTGWTCVSQGIATVSATGTLTVDLQRGEKSLVSFERGAPTALLARLIFHQAFERKPAGSSGIGSLTDRRDVDIYLEVVGAGRHLRIVLDPKYRREPTATGGYAPPAAAVNDMHTYRDAIGRWVRAPGNMHNFQRVLDAAYAIFPAPADASFTKHPYWRSLPEGIGAVPLMPGNLAMLSQCLEQVIFPDREPQEAS
jgi:hypothetical protein